MKSVTIIGGGLAGLTLGIGLRQRGIPVTLWEAGRYPHHRVCGEFISGRGLESLARLDLRTKLDAAGAVHATTVAFFSRTRGSAARMLPEPALGLSRLVLDNLLSGEFRQLGGELREGERSAERDFPEGVVRATGRRAQPREDGWQWFGMKAHARNVALTADLEMHVAPHGYVGLCRINDGAVNVCGLFRRGGQTTDDLKPGRELLRGVPGSLLHERLKSAAFDERSFCAIAGLSLRPHRATDRTGCCVGDSVTMIPPVTGNGMSMAFESAELALAPLGQWSEGSMSWKNTRQTIASRCDAAFARRLVWARRLQALMLAPALHRPLVFLAGRSGLFRDWWFARTR